MCWICFAGNASASVSFELIGAKGEKIGTGTLTEAKEGVTVHLEAKGLPPGKHGIHFHETGLCDPPTFRSAGAHFNPGGKKHGLRSKEGPHSGDLASILVGPKGSVSSSFTTKRVKLASDSLLRDHGTSLVIHEKEDDQKTDPSGDSGERIACGVILTLPPKGPVR